MGGGPVQHGGGERVRLGQEGELAGWRKGRGGTEAEALVRQQEAHLGGAQETDVEAACLGLEGVTLRQRHGAAHEDGGAAAVGVQAVQEGREVGLGEADEGEERAGREVVQRGEDAVGWCGPGGPDGIALDLGGGGEEVALGPQRPGRHGPDWGHRDDPLRLHELAQAAQGHDAGSSSPWNDGGREPSIAHPVRRRSSAG